ncbi:MAG TPA: methyltransferase domain-containing protein [Thermoplasmata archaeon]|nr:methyltransferase domain-containing protein [Thermoplasmata archaeon]
MRFLVELSGENEALAAAELASLLAHHGELRATGPATPPGRWREVELPSEAAACSRIGRMALFRQLLAPRPWPPPITTPGAHSLGTSGTALRWLQAPTPDAPGRLDVLVEQYRAAGGRPVLRDAERELRFWLEAGTVHCFERLAEPDREAFANRRMPRLPYQQPVSLAPKRARALANLAAVEPGDRIVDPFVGTGSLLAEAALLGGRCTGADFSDRMVRGAARNFEHLGIQAERWLVGDAAELAGPFPAWSFDAVLTDPPYGRASGSGGEPPAPLLARVLAAWEHCLVPDGRVALAVPEGSPHPLGGPWRCEVAVPDRVHRSLVREFRVYRRSGEASPGA